MKTWKKTVAFVMTLCVILGMMSGLGMQAASPLTLDVAEKGDGGTVKLYFSSAATVAANNATAYLYIADSAASLTPINYNGVELKWSGTLSNSAWTMNSSLTVNGNAVDSVEEVCALVEDAGLFAGKTVVFALYETAGTKGDGLIDAVTAGSDKLSATITASASAFDGLTIALSEPFTLKNVYYYNDTHFMLEFSEAFTKTGGYELHICIVNENNQLQKINGTSAQGLVVLSGTNAGYYGQQNTEYGYRLYGTLCNDNSAGYLKNYTYTQLKKLVDDHNAQNPNNKWYVKLKLSETTKPHDVKADGVINYFKAIKGNRPLVADVLGVSGWCWNACFVDLTPVTEKVTVTSAKVTGPYSLKVTFSEPIATDWFLPASVAAPFYAVRVVNNNNELQKHNNTNMQWEGTFTPTSDPCVYDFKINDTSKESGIGFNDINSIAKLAKDKGLKLTFCIEQKTASCGDIVGYVDNITSADGIRKLEASAPKNNGNYTVLTGLDAAAEELKLINAEAINDSQIIATFNQPAEVTGSPLMFVSIVGANDALISRGSTPLQWGGVFEWYDEEHTQILWTMSGDTLNISNLADLLTWKGLEQEKEAGRSIKFGICEQATGLAWRSSKNLLVDNYSAKDGYKLLTATTTATTGNNRAYVDIDLADNYNTDPLTMKSVKQLDESKLEVTFSSPVEISPKATFFICMVDENDAVVESPKMRWSCIWEYADEKQDRIIATMTKSVNNDFGLKNISELLEYKNMEGYEQYGYKFSVVEGRGDQVHELANGIVADVTSKGGTKALTATKVMAGQNDRAYQSIEWMEYDPTAVTLDEATLINDTQIKLSFSEAISIKGAPYSFVRLVDENYNVITLNGKPVQYGASLQFDKKDRSKVILTLNASNTNVTSHNSLVDILNFEGELAALDMDGYSWQACIAEKADNTISVLSNNLIENVTAEGRNKMLTATVSKNGSAEAAYASIKYTDLPEGKLNVVSVKAVSDTTAIITFDAPVNITGNPWMAMGLVDENDNLVYKTPDGKPTIETKGNTSMQWGGTWKWNNKEHTEIIWKITRKNHTGVLNLTDLFNYTGLEEFEDYAIKFRIEEAGEDIGKFDKHITNITRADDPRVHLEASYVMGADRMWSDVKVDYLTEHIYSSSRIVNDMQILISFSEPVAIEGTPFIALRFVKDGKLMWDGIPDKSFALQFTGKWEWANDAHTQILWTMDGGNRYGANNLYEVYNYCNGLVKFEGAEAAMCIEEAAPQGVGTTGILENVSSLDGTRHLVSTDPQGNDKIYMDPAGAVSKDLLTVEKVEAIDNMTLEITYSGPIVFATGDAEPSMAIRYLTPTGDTHAVATGNKAIFRGTWEWKEGTDNVMVWTLDTNRSQGAKNLDDIFLFRDNFMFNNNAEIKFCIMDPESEDNVPYTNRVVGVTNPDGTVHLQASRISEFGISVNPINILYELPETETETETEPEEIAPVETVAPNYTWMIATGGGIIVIGAAVMIILLASKKKNGK